MIAEQRIDMEKALIKFRLKNEILKYSGRVLSIFNEDTTDTTFMRKKTIKIKYLFFAYFLFNFYLKVIPNDAVKLEIGPHLKALLSG